MAHLDRYDRAKALSRDMLISVKNFLESVTVILLCFEKQDEVATVQEVCSGTLVKIGHRYFVATCGHAIRKYDFKKIAVSYSKIKNTRIPFIYPFKDMKYIDDKLFDLGWLEVDEKFVEHFDKEFLDPSRISSGINIKDDCLVVTGFPSDQIPRDLLQKKTAQVQQAIYSAVNTTIENEEIIKEYHLTMAYKLDGQIKWNFEDDPMPTPRGMSGGGIWDLNVLSEEGVWSYKRCTLIGIEFQWWEKSKMVQGNHAKYWLEKNPFI